MMFVNVARVLRRWRIGASQFLRQLGLRAKSILRWRGCKANFSTYLFSIVAVYWTFGTHRQFVTQTICFVSFVIQFRKKHESHDWCWIFCWSSCCFCCCYCIGTTAFAVVAAIAAAAPAEDPAPVMWLVFFSKLDDKTNKKSCLCDTNVRYVLG